MANLCIKTPSSAILVLIFQLLVLRPRPNGHPYKRNLSNAHLPKKKVERADNPLLTSEKSSRKKKALSQRLIRNERGWADGGMMRECYLGNGFRKSQHLMSGEGGNV